MAKNEFPSQGLDKFVVRFPEGMRERIAEAAKENNRSMNAEIVARLEVSFSVDKRNAFELLKKAMEVIESTERSIARFDDDIAALNEGDAGPLEWLIDGGVDRDRLSHEEAIDAARHIQSLLKEDVSKAQRFVPTLMSAIKNGGPIPVEIQEFLSRA